MHPDAEANSRQPVTVNEGFASRGRFKSSQTMNPLTTLLSILLMAALPQAHAQVPAAAPGRLVATTNLPYATPTNPRQMVDVYAPEGAKNLPVVFWIHGGGWEGGDRTAIQLKPQAFVDKGFVFVSTGYRLLAEVEMATIFRDIAKSLGWVHGNIAQYGGDPTRIHVMGHSAGAQLAALICTDEPILESA